MTWNRRSSSLLNLERLSIDPLPELFRQGTLQVLEQLLLPQPAAATDLRRKEVTRAFRLWVKQADVNTPAARSSRRRFLSVSRNAEGPWPTVIDAAVSGQFARRSALLRDSIGSILRRRRPGGPGGAGHVVWSVIAMSYAAADFRSAVARLMHDSLITQVIFHPDGPPLVRLADATCLVLLLNVGWLHNLPEERGFVEALARTAAQEPAWAGIWDQYILMQLRLAQLKLPHELLDLPLVSSGSAALARTDDDDPKQVTTGWREAVPEYFRHYLEGGF